MTLNRSATLSFSIAALFSMAILATSSVSANTPGSATPVRLVAIKNQTYQGTTGTRLFDSFNGVQVDALGRATFDGYFAGDVGGIADHGIWSERDGGILKEIVHSGDPHPPAVSPYHFVIATAQPVVHDDTVVFVDEILDDPGAFGKAVWAGLPNQDLRLVAVNKILSGVTAFQVADSSNGLAIQDATTQGYVALTFFEIGFTRRSRLGMSGLSPKRVHLHRASHLLATSTLAIRD